MKTLKNRLLKLACVVICFMLTLTFTATGVYALINSSLTGSGADAYYTVTPDSDSYEIQIPVGGVEIAKDAIVTIPVYIEGKGMNDCGYSKAKFVSVENYVIDDALPTEEWVKITAQTKVLFDGQKTFVKVTIKDAEGLNVRIKKDVKATQNGVFAEKLLGGAMLYQLPCGEMEQNCSYVVVTASGKLIVYDGGNEGDADYLLDFLYTFKSEVDHWFISHLHSDHIGAISYVLKTGGIVINNLYHDLPELTDGDGAKGKENPTSWYKDFMEYSKDKSVVKNVHVVQKDDVINIDDVTFTVLNGCMNYSNNWGNNTTVVYRMDTLGESVLFLGDAGIELGEWLVNNNAEKLKGCAIVQAAHHGQNGCDRAFYEFIDSKIWLVPAPTNLWYGAQYDIGVFKYHVTSGVVTHQVRAWMREMEVVKVIVAKDGLAAIK